MPAPDNSHKMHTIEIPDANKIIELPECWEECTPDQVRDITAQAFQVIYGSMPLEDFTRRVFCMLTGLKSSVRYELKHRLGLTSKSDEMLCILADQLCKWPFRLLTDADGNKSFQFQYDTTTNFFKEIKAGSTTLYGPDDLLEDITFSEFQWANNHSQEYYNENKNQEGMPIIPGIGSHEALESIDYFVACLYRPGSNGKRAAFNPDTVFETVELLKKVPYITKFCILLWYSYCVHVIQTTPLTIQGTEIDFSILFPAPTKAQKDGLETVKQGLGWRGALYDLAESGVFGDIERTERTLFFTVLVYMYKKQLDNVRASTRI